MRRAFTLQMHDAPDPNAPMMHHHWCRTGEHKIECFKPHRGNVRKLMPSLLMPSLEMCDECYKRFRQELGRP